jgi:hypothetical protein
MKSNLFRCLCIALIVISLFGSLSSIYSQTEKEIPSLEPAKLVEKQLKPGESQSYSLSIQSGQFLNIILEQKGIELESMVN